MNAKLVLAVASGVVAVGLAALVANSLVAFVGIVAVMALATSTMFGTA